MKSHIDHDEDELKKIIREAAQMLKSAGLSKEVDDAIKELGKKISIGVQEKLDNKMQGIPKEFLEVRNKEFWKLLL